MLFRNLNNQPDIFAFLIWWVGRGVEGMCYTFFRNLIHANVWSDAALMVSVTVPDPRKVKRLTPLSTHMPIAYTFSHNVLENPAATGITRLNYFQDRTAARCKIISLASDWKLYLFNTHSCFFGLFCCVVFCCCYCCCCCFSCCCYCWCCCMSVCLGGLCCLVFCGGFCGGKNWGWRSLLGFFGGALFVVFNKLH